MEEWEREGRLGARFCFTKPSVVTADKLASTLARGLAERAPEICFRVLQVLKEEPELLSKHLQKQLKSLVFGPLKEEREELMDALDAVRGEKRDHLWINAPEIRPKYVQNTFAAKGVEQVYLEALEKTNVRFQDKEETSDLEESYGKYLDAVEISLEEQLKRPFILVVDALDECAAEHRRIVLQEMLDPQVKPYPFKLFLTCRPESDIEAKIKNRDDVICRPVHRLLSNEYKPDNDIYTYAANYLGDTLNSSQTSQFVQRAKGLFIWAATARQFLNVDKGLVEERFEMLMAPAQGDSPLASLYQLYHEILTTATTGRPAHELEIMRKVLQVVAVSREPISVSTIFELVMTTQDSSKRKVEAIIANLHSVLSDGSNGRPVYALHPTFVEYLQLGLQHDRLRFTLKEANILLSAGCLNSLNAQLQYDICDVKRLGTRTPLNREIMDLEGRMQESTTLSLCYAALYYLSHVAETLGDKKVLNELKSFFQEQLLHWIELMSLLGKIYMLMQSTHRLKVHMERQRRPEEYEERKGQEPDTALVSDYGYHQDAVQSDDDR